MRRIAIAALLAISAVVGALAPARAQTPTPGNNTPPPVVTHSAAITPVGGIVMGSIFTAAAAPIVGTIVLGREMTPNEVYRSTLTSFLGPVGWWLGNVYFPDAPGGNPPPRGTQQAQGRNISIPPPGATNFMSNEVLTQIPAGASPRLQDRIASSLQLTLLETQTFALGGRTQLWRINDGGSVVAKLRALSRFPVISAQANFVYKLTQAPPPAPSDASAAQYVVSKMHLLDAHRISNGDDVLVAVIDSKIDAGHPDLAGVIASDYDAVGTPAKPHSHGTAMASAIAAHSKLIGVAPKVRLLAIRAFSGEGESAQSTTFSLLKAIDWAAGQNARIINMSFAGPPDPMVRDMLGKASARGIVLIAAVGNAGPRSPPLYPAADAHVIGVTATDAEDKLLAVANRGPQVALAAPGVDILAAAPDGEYQVTTGTSVAAAHASGVAALLLARKPELKPDDVRRVLIRSAHATGGKRNDVGAGVIDALGAVNSLGD